MLLAAFAFAFAAEAAYGASRETLLFLDVTFGIFSRECL
jgi:hypothetical protein